MKHSVTGQSQLCSKSYTVLFTTCLIGRLKFPCPLFVVNILKTQTLASVQDKISIFSLVQGKPEDFDWIYSFSFNKLWYFKNNWLEHLNSAFISIFAFEVCLVKAMVFPVVMYGCESWTVKKAEHRGTDAFELCVGEDSWESPGLQEDPASPF